MGSGPTPLLTEVTIIAIEQGEYREAHLFSQLLLYYYLVVSLTLQKTALW